MRKFKNYYLLTLTLIGWFLLISCSDEVVKELELDEEFPLVTRKDWGAKSLNHPEKYLYPNSELQPSYIKNIVIHHTETRVAKDKYKMIRSIQSFHRNNGFDDIGYHFIVATDGTIFEGRSIQYIGAHAGKSEKSKKWNEFKYEKSEVENIGSLPADIYQSLWADPDYRSIGVAVEGNFDVMHIKNYPLQKRALIKLLNYLKSRYHVPKSRIIGHREVEKKILSFKGLHYIGNKKTCPGSNFDLVSMIKELNPDTDLAVKKVVSSTQ